jgi:ketosteroid isomerase-like protein
MSNVTKPQNALEALDAHIDLITRDIDGWLTLFAEDAVVEFPYAAGVNLPGKLVGKAAIREYFSHAPEVFKDLRFRDVRRYATQDPEIAIGEAHGSATIATTSRPYEQDYVFFVHFRDGAIIRYREYWNPNAANDSFDGKANVASAMGVK